MAIVMQDKKTLEKFTITPDEIVHIQNTSGGHLGVHDLKEDKDDPELTLKVDEVLDLSTLDFGGKDKTKAKINRSFLSGSGGLAYALERGKIQILTILKGGDVLRIAEPIETRTDWNRETSRPKKAAQDVLPGKENYYDVGLEMREVREEADELETQRRTRRLTQEQKDIVSGAMEEKLSEERTELRREMTGERERQEVEVVAHKPEESKGPVLDPGKGAKSLDELDTFVPEKAKERRRRKVEESD